MSEKSSLAYAYLMGYDDALAKRKPDASKTEVLASGDLAAENAKLREEFNKMDVWHSKELTAAMDENAKLRELLQRLLMEYRYISVRPRKVYMQHERRMRVIEEEMRELGVEVPD